MAQPKRWGKGVVEHQEIAFSLCMALVAVLGRSNPQLEYPQILWLFAGLLLFNLAYHLLLKRLGGHWMIPFVSIAVNIVMVSAILFYSGGAQSQFWPMYLLPIFTACIYMESWHILFSFLACVGFLSYFYLELLWKGLFWDQLELLVKFAVLGLSAGITSWVSFSEREARIGLEKSRSELNRLAKSFLEASLAAPESSNGLEQWIGAMLHSLNNGLMVIAGTSEVLLAEINPPNPDHRADFNRIQSAAQALSAMTSSLLSWSKKDVAGSRPIALDKALTPVLQLLDFKLKLKGLQPSIDIPKGLPQLRWNSAILQQAFATLLTYVIDQSAPAGSLDIRVALGSNDSPMTGGKENDLRTAVDTGPIEVRIAFKSRSENSSRTGFESAKNIFTLQGGTVVENRFPERWEIVIVLPSSPDKH